MNTENSQHLLEKFPELFKYRSQEHTRVNSPTPSLMYYGFQCEDGWLSLIEDTLSKLQEKYNVLIPDFKESFYVSQIKQKYGMLRIYLAPGSFQSAEIQGILHRAEVESATTCELCGNPGMLWFKKGTYATRCSLHSTE